MANADLRIFMDDLKKIIHGNHHPLFNNSPLILFKRPQFQLLYQELDSIIQTLFSIHQDHHPKPDELEKVRDLKKRFKDAIEEAQDHIDFFLSALHLRNNGVSPRSDILKTSLDLNKILESIKSIKMELKTINIGNMKMDSSSRIYHVKTQSVVAAAGTSYTRYPLGIKKPSEEFLVGLECDVEIIRDKLTEDTKQLCVVSIVGMGGLGKTTLATKLFNDPFVVYHFHVRAWVTVSQSYKRRDLLIQILISIGVQQDLDEAPDSKLHEKMHKKLMEEESWELLKQKVFYGDECPKYLITPGRHIARKCHGLPLSVVVMAGLLAKKPRSKDLWEEIACSISSYHKGNLETLALSYRHLPDHLRECFLFLGGFPEDFMIDVKRVICLWMAEGFIEEARNRSLEDTAKAYLIDLINRNLVLVAKRNAIGDVKACKVHDLVRELCMQRAKEEGFFLKIDSPTSSSNLLEGIRYKQRRIFTHEDVANVDLTRFTSETIRSVLCFYEDICSVKVIAQSFVLLRVLDLQECRLDDFPQGLALLVHLRYLAIAIWNSCEFPESICKLWSLQTLILKTRFSTSMHLPRNIADLVNLRHLWSNNWFYLSYIEKPMNLHSISLVILEDGIDNFQKCFPNIKKLVLYCGFDFPKYVLYLKLLPCLEILKLRGSGLRWRHFVFPATLKKLSLISCEVPWSHMSIIQLLPNLEVLELKYNACIGRQWDAFEQQFRQLKLLKLYGLISIRRWEASSTSFPCLKRLSVSWCKDLEEIPLEIGEIATLELVEIGGCSNSVVESVKRIQQAQHDVGNYELKITVNGKELSFYLSQHESSASE